MGICGTPQGPVHVAAVHGGGVSRGATGSASCYHYVSPGDSPSNSHALATVGIQNPGSTSGGPHFRAEEVQLKQLQAAQLEAQQVQQEEREGSADAGRASQPAAATKRACNGHARLLSGAVLSLSGTSSDMQPGSYIV